jgi:hypothetical protein
LIFVASVAYAKPTLRLEELPAIAKKPEPPRMLAAQENNVRFEPALVLIEMRAAQLAEPRSHGPNFVPLLGTTCIGGSLRLDF